MTWPRLWRLFTVPRPGTRWTDGAGWDIDVCYLEGAPGPRRVVVRDTWPAFPSLGRPYPVPLWTFRRTWVWCREVRP